LENLTFTDGIDAHTPATLHSHGKGLKRVAGIGVDNRLGVCGEFVNKSSGLGIHSEEARHSGWFGLPEPSGDRHFW
jgi:hypothetical protein